MEHAASLKICELCGQTFACGAEQTETPCWCMALPVVKSIPEIYKNCLCPDCLSELAQQQERA